MAKVLTEEDKQFIRDSILCHGMIGQLIRKSGDTADKELLEYANAKFEEVQKCKTFERMQEIKKEIETKLLS
jgi:hypothetical protein